MLEQRIILVAAPKKRGECTLFIVLDIAALDGTSMIGKIT